MGVVLSCNGAAQDTSSGGQRFVLAGDPVGLDEGVLRGGFHKRHTPVYSPSPGDQPCLGPSLAHPWRGARAVISRVSGEELQ